jgi:hypothetical protein
MKCTADSITTQVQQMRLVHVEYKDVLQITAAVAAAGDVAAGTSAQAYAAV